MGLILYKTEVFSWVMHRFSIGRSHDCISLLRFSVTAKNVCVKAQQQRFLFSHHCVELTALQFSSTTVINKTFINYHHRSRWFQVLLLMSN